MTIFFWILIGICFAMLILFVAKELWRNGTSGLKEIIKKDSKDNLNDLFGITKTTFLVLMFNLIIISVAFLSFIETRNQGKETGGLNLKTAQILQHRLDRLVR